MTRDGRKVSYPIFLDLSSRKVLVVGAGRVATRKIERLVPTGARLHVVALAASAPVRKLSQEAALQWEARAPRECDLEGVFLAIAATDDDAVNAQVATWARAHGALVSRVDDPTHSDFTVPAYVRGRHSEATVSTFGEAPSASRRLTGELERWLRGAPDRFAGEVASVRRALTGRADSSQRLRKLNESGLYEACLAGDEARIRALVDGALAGIGGGAP